MKFYLLTLLALTLLDNVAIAQEPARNPYISQAAWEEIEPGRNFIYQVIGHSVAIIQRLVIQMNNDDLTNRRRGGAICSN